jgi:acyl carrier protein
MGLAAHPGCGNMQPSPTIREYEVTHREFLNYIAEIIEVEPNSLKGDEKLADFEHWDSLALVGFIAMVDEHLEMTLPAKKIAAAKTVADLVALMGNKVKREAAVA